MWWPSELVDHPTSSACASSPSRLTADSVAKTSAPAPSARTNPARSTLKGRLACAGSCSDRSPGLASQERLHRREAVDHRRRERTFAGAAEGQFGVSRSQEHRTQDDRMPPRGTRVGRRGARAVEPEVLGDLAGRLIDDHRRDEIRTDRQAAAPDHPILLGLEQVEPAERRTHDHRGAVRVKLALEPVQPGVGPCLASRSHRKMNETAPQAWRSQDLPSPSPVRSLRPSPPDPEGTCRRRAPRGAESRTDLRPGLARSSSCLDPGRSPRHVRQRKSAPASRPPDPAIKSTADAQRRRVQFRRTASFIIFDKFPTLT